MFKSAIRGITAAGFAAALMGSVAAPALGVEAPELALLQEDILLTPGGPSQDVRPLLLASKAVEVTGAKLKADFSGLTGIAKVTAEHNQDCAVSGAVLTCDLGTILADGLEGTTTFQIEPAAGAKLDDSGELKLTFSGDGGADLTTTVPVHIAEGVDLYADDDVNLKAAPGGKISVPQLTVANIGETAANGVVALFQGETVFLAGSARYSNCWYHHDILRACAFDENLTPGAVYTPATPLEFVLRQDAESGRTPWTEISWMTPDDWAVVVKQMENHGRGEWLGAPGTEDPLTLKQVQAGKSAQTDPDTSNNTMSLTVEVTGNNFADFAAIGGKGAGAAGDIISVDLGYKNDSKATSDSLRSGDSRIQATIKLPQGTSLTEMPKGCLAVGDNPESLAGKEFACLSQLVIPAGSAQTWKFKLRIDSVVKDAQGSVMLSQSWNPDRPADKNAANDKALIVVNGSGEGGELPVTGVQTGLFAMIGAILVAAGGAVFVLTRRRRVSVAD